MILKQFAIVSHLKLSKIVLESSALWQRLLAILCVYINILVIQGCFLSSAALSLLFLEVNTFLNKS